MHAALQDLRRAGLSPLEAQRLLLHALGRCDTDRAWLLAHDTQPLPTQAQARLAQLLARQQSGEPLAYLLGHQAFHGLDLQVGPGVLVPRPDTETLVDWALALTLPTQARVLDLGTGSGAIALALAAARPNWQVWASDLSAPALAIAQANAQRLGLRLRWLQGAWFEALPAQTPPFDLIVANPPYISATDPHLAALHAEPSLALVSGPDGLDDLRILCAQAPAHLAAGGWLLLEHGWDQAEPVGQLLRRSGGQDVQWRADLAGIARVSGARWPQRL